MYKLSILFLRFLICKNATFNIIYLLAKKYLYQCRCKSTFPDIAAYKLQLQKLINTEKGICVMNNQMDIYLGRWGDFI